LISAELLAVEEAAMPAELPGRQIGGAWRFSRQALLDRLGTT